MPPELSADIARSASLAQQAWIEARADSDFDRFRPHLERNLELKNRYVECFESTGELYDVLLDDYEHGTVTSEVRELFALIKERLVPLIAAVGEAARLRLASAPAGLTWALAAVALNLWASPAVAARAAWPVGAETVVPAGGVVPLARAAGAEQAMSPEAANRRKSHQKASRCSLSP